ncbi:hypothetical protein [Micromonospora tulbaghiae]|uniref:hypothetical protein n=1 Tax=Micromonospora TaxID=1873 RepID=UPI0013BD2667|nr:hypothetical protein [Micromonospora aurantiaca]
MIASTAANLAHSFTLFAEVVPRVDGLMVVCSAAMLAIGQAKRATNGPATSPAHVPEPAPPYARGPSAMDRPALRASSASKAARWPAAARKPHAAAKPPPPRWFLVETLYADHLAWLPGPNPVQAVADRNGCRKHGTTDAVRIVRKTHMEPIHLSDSAAGLDGVAV